MIYELFSKVYYIHKTLNISHSLHHGVKHSSSLVSHSWIGFEIIVDTLSSGADPEEGASESTSFSV